MHYFQPFSQTPGPHPITPMYQGDNIYQSSITYPTQTSYLGGGYVSPLAYAQPPPQYMEQDFFPSSKPQLFPAIPKQLPLLQKAKQDMKNLKEQRIIRAIERQTDILNEIIAKYGEAGDSKEALEKKIEELERQSVEIKFKRKQEALIKHSVEKKIDSLLNHGMSYNPFFPQPLPYLMFKLPKIKNTEEEEEKKRREREQEQEEYERQKREEKKRRKKAKKRRAEESQQVAQEEQNQQGEQNQIADISGYHPNAADENGIKGKKGRKGRRRGLPPIRVDI